MESVDFLSGRIHLIQGDITLMDVDVIVNAANNSLLGGGGVDGAIHRAAGPQLLESCRQIGGCATGDAVITPGFRLKARYVIHTVGPVWRGGQYSEPSLLASCYRKSLQLAASKNLTSIAFPNISTGVYGYPKKEAAQIAINSVVEFLGEHELPQAVWFVCYDWENYDLYDRALKAKI